MTAQLFTCPSCFTRGLFSDIEANNYACPNSDCILSERLVVHSELNSKGQVTRLYGWVMEPGEFLRGRYEIIKLIGKGGYGATYEAKYRELLKQTFAIKETPRVYCDNEEDEFLLNLSHPGVPKLFDRFNQGDLHYMIMEFIEGESLQQLASNHPNVGYEQLILKIVEQVCDVLGYIHSEGVIHRDLKPENILVRRNGSVAIVDFGIAKRFVPGVQTRHLARAASHFYAPPEQYETGKGNTDARSDVYSLGAILFFLLTSRDPIDAINRKASGAVHPLPSEINPNISPKLEQVVVRAMSMRPEDRFENMIEFKKALQAAGAISTRVCPNCGRLYRGTKNLCHECGSPTNPLGKAENAPFVFRSGEKAANLQEFIQVCYQHWDDALWHLYQGDFEPWLISIQEGALAERAANIKRLIDNQNLGLNQFLMSSPYGRPPKLELSHNKIDFIGIKPGIQKRIVITLYNAGQGYLQGEIQMNSPFLSADNYTFSCFSGESKHITLTLLAGNFTPYRSFKTNVVLETNVGSKTIPVTIAAEPPAVQWKIAPSKLHSEIVENQSEVKGFTVEVVTSHGKLEGSVTTSQSWLHLQPVSFKGRSQIIRVEIDAHRLQPGTYQGEITVQTNHGERVLEVELFVKKYSPPVVKPTIELKKSHPLYPWKKAVTAPIIPIVIFVLLFISSHFFYPHIEQITRSSMPAIVFGAMGALIGLCPSVRNWLNNFFIGAIVGILTGLVFSLIWKPLVYFIESWEQFYIIRLIRDWFNLTPTLLLEYVLFGVTGLFFGGLLGLLVNIKKFRSALNFFFLYILLFVALVLLLCFGIILILKIYQPQSAYYM